MSSILKYLLRPIYNLGSFLWTKIDQGFIDKFLPKWERFNSCLVIAKKAKKRFQSGFIFDYTFIIITGFTLFITVLFSIYQFHN
jgi:hypothetical protein